MAKSWQEIAAETISQRQQQSAMSEAIRTADEREAAAPASGLNDLYKQYFGRDVDQEGLDFYQNEIAKGNVTLAEMESILAAAPEHEFYLDMQNPDTDRAFNDMLSRNAQREGEEFYKGMSYDDIIAAIAGEEARNGRESEFRRYFNSDVPEKPTAGAEGEYPYHTESSNPYSPEAGGDARGFRNPNTRPLSPEELAAQQGGLAEQAAGWDGGKPWESWGGWEDNPYYDFGDDDAGGGDSGGIPGEPRPVTPVPDYEQYGSNPEMYKGQLQQLMAQRARYHDNVEPNIGGPSLSSTPPPMTQPGNSPPRTGNEYIDPLTGQPIDFKPFNAASTQSAAQIAAAAQGNLGR